MILIGAYKVSDRWEFMCGDDVLAEDVSPNGKKKVTVFQRDCGATTGFSTQASILDAESKLPARGGNVLWLIQTTARPLLVLAAGRR